MADPRLKKTSVNITYWADDGYKAECQFKGGDGSKHIKTGDQIPPQQAMIAAVAELARITALFGYQDEAKKAFDDAQQRVAEWKKSREQRLQ